MEFETWTIQLRKGLAELILLKVLDMGEAYGYEIMQRLKVVSLLSLGESTVYPLLGRLTEEGYLLVRSTPSPSGPPRRYYRLTPKGRSRLHAMTSYWESLNASINELKEYSHES